MFGLFTFASIGLPGLSGFIGEFLVILGAFAYNGWVAAIAMVVVILSAVYMLWMFQRAFFTVPSDWMRRFWPSLRDMSRGEWVALSPLIVLVVAARGLSGAGARDDRGAGRPHRRGRQRRRPHRLSGRCGEG